MNTREAVAAVIADFKRDLFHKNTVETCPESLWIKNVVNRTSLHETTIRQPDPLPGSLPESTEPTS